MIKLFIAMGIIWIIAGILGALIFWYDLQYNLRPDEFDEDFEEEYRRDNKWDHLKRSLWIIKWGLLGLFISFCGYHLEDD